MSSEAKKVIFCTQACVTGRTGCFLRSVMCGCRIRYYLLSAHSCWSGDQWQDDSRSDDFHLCSTDGTANDESFFLSAGKHAERIDPQYHLKEFNKFLAAGMKEAVISYPAKPLGQDMEHEQIKELFSAHCPGPVLSGFGVQIAKGHHTFFASQDVFFLNDNPVEIPPKIDDGFVAVANVFTIDDPFFGAIPGQFQALIDQGFHHLCPENLGQGLVVEGEYIFLRRSYGA